MDSAKKAVGTAAQPVYQRAETGLWRGAFGAPAIRAVRWGKGLLGNSCYGAPPEDRGIFVCRAQCAAKAGKVG